MYSSFIFSSFLIGVSFLIGFSFLVSLSSENREENKPDLKPKIDNNIRTMIIMIGKKYFLRKLVTLSSFNLSFSTIGTLNCLPMLMFTSSEFKIPESFNLADTVKVYEPSLIVDDGAI